MRPAVAGSFRVENAGCALAQLIRGESDDAGSAGKARKGGRFYEPLQIERDIVTIAPQLTHDGPHGTCVAGLNGNRPIHNRNEIDDLGMPRIDEPVDRRIGMGAANRSYRRYRINNVAELADPDDEDSLQLCDGE